MIRRTLKWVAGVHGALLLALMISSLVKGCSFRKKKPQPLSIEVSMVSEPAPPAAQIQEVQQMPLEQVQPPAPTPEPTPIPEQKKSEPKQPKKKWEPKKVIRQDAKVRNPNLKPKPAVKPLPDISKALTGAMPKTITSSSNSNLSASYSQQIRSIMYEAWHQPSIATYQSQGALVRIRIEKNGIISSATLEKSSGNALINSTALQAARSVRLPPLPANIQQSFVEVTIEFTLTN